MKRTDEINNIFDFWKETFNVSKRSYLDLPRFNCIEAALEMGYTEEDLRKAISGCKKSEWHQGRNESGQQFFAITLIFRDCEHIDRFIKIEDEAAKKEENRKQRVIDEQEEKKLYDAQHKERMAYFFDIINNKTDPKDSWIYKNRKRSSVF